MSDDRVIPDINWLSVLADNREDQLFIIDLLMSTYNKGDPAYEELEMEKEHIMDLIFEEIFL